MTGAAGFIGSHLSEALIEGGHRVRGIDRFSDYYSKHAKRRNLSGLLNEKGFQFVEGDLTKCDLGKLVDGCEYVFHLAAQPGVRGSWGTSFDVYVRDNVIATQRLLEAVKGRGVKRFILASSSSIYGDSERYPTPEDATPKPVSPYGVTKLGAEHLCHVYLRNYNVPTVVLRYFTVYGPRQRPDMAFSIFISRIIAGEAITIFGDGSQRRDFTYVGDTVRATVSAMAAPIGSVYNVGAGKSIPLNKIISLLESLLGRRAKVSRKSFASGDVLKTRADITRITRDLGYRASFPLREGLKRQIEMSFMESER